MDFENFTPVSALIGGVAIGTSASLLLWFNGRIAGITGILAELLHPRAGEVGWRLAFVLGLAVGAFGLALAMPGVFTVHPDRSLGTIAIAGLIVGFGTRMGNGCTSGHGVCGIPRGSLRSIVATLTFIATGAITVGIVQRVFGGSL